MANYEKLGVFEEDPASRAGADALELLEAQMQADNKAKNVSWASSEYMDDIDDDPKAVSTRAAIKQERTFDAYRQGGAWNMQEGQEYSPHEH